MASNLALKSLARKLVRIGVEVGDRPAVKTCDQLCVPVEREGPAYRYCYPPQAIARPMYRYCYQHSVMSARVLREQVLSYYARNQVSQETGRPGEDMGQLPAAAPVEPEEMPPAIKYFCE